MQLFLRDRFWNIMILVHSRHQTDRPLQICSCNLTCNFQKSLLLWSTQADSFTPHSPQRRKNMTCRATAKDPLGSQPQKTRSSKMLCPLSHRPRISEVSQLSPRSIICSPHPKTRRQKRTSLIRTIAANFPGHSKSKAGSASSPVHILVRIRRHAVYSRHALLQGLPHAIHLPLVL
jgi:hypothetical protein